MTAYALLVPILMSRTRYCAAQARGTGDGFVGISQIVHVVPPFVLWKIFAGFSPEGYDPLPSGSEVPANKRLPLTAMDSNRRQSVGLFGQRAGGGEISVQASPVSVIL